MDKQEYKGIPISPGMAVEKPYFIEQEKKEIPNEKIYDVKAEVGNFIEACHKTITKIEKMEKEAKKRVGGKEAEVFAVHAAILKDQYSFISPVQQKIECEKKNASLAVEEQLKFIEKTMSESDSELFQARASDIRDIRNQLISEILHSELGSIPTKEPCIIVTHELTPSMTMKMDFSYVKGIVSEVGGPTSHAAIIAKSLGIPAVAGIADAMEHMDTEEMIILDGDAGNIIIHASEEEIEKAKDDVRRQEEEVHQLKKYIGCPSKTRDGKTISLYGNIGNGAEARNALQEGAEGIGLFRSEFLYLNRDTLPSEEEQFQEYKKALEVMGTKRVIVRTLDIGGDKPQKAIDIEEESNPFLGFRAIRLCLKRKELFQTQLRALLRASEYGNLAIMFPMISSIEELEAAKEELQNVADALRKEGVLIKDKIPVGMMMEIPSAAILANEFAKKVDFFSIGTNDLTQYTLAVDRGNEAVSELYTIYHPAVLKLIKNIAEAAHKEGIECGICGEAGGDRRLLPLWIGLGIDELYTVPKSILKIRKSLAKLDCKKCNKLVDKVFKMNTASDIKKLLEGKEEK